MNHCDGYKDVVDSRAFLELRGFVLRIGDDWKTAHHRVDLLENLARTRSRRLQELLTSGGTLLFF